MPPAHQAASDVKFVGYFGRCSTNYSYLPELDHFVIDIRGTL